MTVFVFIVVLVALIVVHEFGHFVVAKLSGMRVDEFGLGYPPRALVLAKKGDTEYTLNWLPFGGFVKIYGEDEAATTATAGGEGTARAFYMKPRILQAATLLAGIGMNLLFAWLLISLTLYIGVPRALSAEEALQARDRALVISEVLPGSPAAEAGLQPGDSITHARTLHGDFAGYDPAAFTALADDGAPVALTLDRGGKALTVTATPRAGIITADPARPALGVAVASVGVLPVAWWRAPIDGAVLTWEITKETAAGLWHFFASIATLTADLSQVSGPVGIAGAVGHAARSGIAQLLSLTAIISINLALINLVPIPALDGGRLLFVGIEAVLRRPLNPKIASGVNTVGFALLILLMVVVTAHDVFKLFG